MRVEEAGSIGNSIAGTTVIAVCVEAVSRECMWSTQFTSSSPRLIKQQMILIITETNQKTAQMSLFMCAPVNVAYVVTVTNKWLLCWVFCSRASVCFVNNGR